MNSLYNHAVKQITTLRKDLQRFEDDITNSPLSLQGSIAANISTLTRTVDEYESLVKNETNPEKQEKARIRLNNFRNDISESKFKLNELKQQKLAKLEENDRAELLKHRRLKTDNPYDGGSSTSSSSYPGSDLNSDKRHLLYQEHTSLARSSQALDDILETGYAAFEQLTESNKLIQQFQSRLNNSLTTLGVSQETISNIDRIAFKQKWVFYTGALLMFVCFYFIIKWFR